MLNELPRAAVLAVAVFDCLSAGSFHEFVENPFYIKIFDAGFDDPIIVGFVTII